MAAAPPRPAAGGDEKDTEAGGSVDIRFLAALQRMVADADVSTDDGVRQAIGQLTPEQRADLLSEGAELKAALMSDKPEMKASRQKFMRIVSQKADEADKPGPADYEFLSKKVRARGKGCVACLHRARAPRPARTSRAARLPFAPHNSFCACTCPLHGSSASVTSVYR